MNFDLIRKTVEYLEKEDVKNIKFIYNITTNGVLLDKYMDFLANYNFRMLISLDGDEFCNAYRINSAGKNSFHKVYNNIKKVQLKYPDYYKRYINFNTVLHAKNSIVKILDFFERNFNKIPRINELNFMGIRKEKKQEFERTYNSMSQSAHLAPHYLQIENKIFSMLPEIREITLFLYNNMQFIYDSYYSFYIEKNKRFHFPTGTCLPFSRKMFMTVNGKILPCENVPHCFDFFGNVRECVDIDSDRIAHEINRLYDLLNIKCEQCYDYCSCTQCIYVMENKEGTLICEQFSNEKKMTEFYKRMLNIFELRPELYKKIMEGIIIH